MSAPMELDPALEGKVFAVLAVRVNGWWTITVHFDGEAESRVYNGTDLFLLMNRIQQEVGRQ